MQNQLGNNTWNFLQNSKIFPAWNEENGALGYWESMSQILGFHMGQCNKSAMILSNPDAIRLYTVLSMREKPVYFGKDIIDESILGYRYFGLFPTKLIWNSNYYFQAGFTNWWQDYIKWAIQSKTKSEVLKNERINIENRTLSNENPNQSGVYVLACIPAFGLLVSILAFIAIDIGFGKILRIFPTFHTKVERVEKSFVLKSRGKALNYYRITSRRNLWRLQTKKFLTRNCLRQILKLKIILIIWWNSRYRRTF